MTDDSQRFITETVPDKNKRKEVLSMFGFRAKKKEKERIKKEALENARTEQVIRTIEETFPSERGLRSSLGSIEMLGKVLAIVTGKAPKDRYLFLKFLGRDPNSATEQMKFEKMYTKING